MRGVTCSIFHFLRFFATLWLFALFCYSIAMQKFIALLIVSLIALGGTFYVFPAQRHQGPSSEATTEASSEENVTPESPSSSTSSDNDVDALLEELRRERLESAGIAVEEDDADETEESDENNAEETAPENEEEEAPPTEEVVPSGFDRSNPSGNYEGTWENVHIGTSGTLSLSMDGQKITLSNNDGGGDYIPSFQVDAEVDLTAETVTINGMEVVGDLEGETAEDLSFWFTLKNIPNQPFDAYAKGQMSEDGKTLTGNIWTFPAGSTAITSEEECTNAPICHQNDYTATLQ